jgi:hypothetical protein
VKVGTLYAGFHNKNCPNIVFIIYKRKGHFVQPARGEGMQSTEENPSMPTFWSSFAPILKELGQMAKPSALKSSGNPSPSLLMISARNRFDFYLFLP